MKRVIHMVKLTTGDIDQFLGRYSLGRDSSPLNSTGSQHFLRIKVPGGFLDSKQLRQIANLTKRYSRDHAEITNRQSIQLHWIDAQDALEIFSIMDKIGFTTDMCGQGFKGARYGDARNILCCPVSGFEKDELLNGAPLLRKLSDFFIGNPDFLDMPKKFKFSISGCGYDCTRAVINDLAFVAVKKNDSIGYTLLAGGGIGATLPGPRLAQPLKVFVETEDAFDVAVAAIEIHRDNSSRESKTKARFKWLLHNWGIEKYLNKLEDKLGKRLEEYDGPIFLKNGGHYGVQPQSQEGHYYVSVPFIGGILSSADMISLADLADEYGNGELSFTPQQNIIVLNVERKNQLLKRLTENGFSIEGPQLKWNSMGCASNFCGKSAAPHAKDVTNDLVEHLQTSFNKELLDEAAFRIHVSGCPNNCCANLIAEIGLRGRLTRDHGELKQNYAILLGGGFGVETSMGKQIEENVPANELGSKINSILTNYFKKRKTSENLREFCNRHSTEELKTFMNSVGE